MHRKQLTLVTVSLLVVVLSVSLAWFTTQIIGKGKDVSNTSAKLDYPIGLMTADEVSFAGGGTFMDESAPAYYYQNSAGNSSTSDTWWWTMSPNSWREGVPGTMLVVYGSREPGILEPRAYSVLDNIGTGVRPVISLKSCVKYSSGNGSANEPYTIKETTSGC